MAEGELQESGVLLIKLQFNTRYSCGIGTLDWPGEWSLGALKFLENMQTLRSDSDVTWLQYKLKYLQS
jgi:hypothetical protein